MVDTKSKTVTEIFLWLVEHDKLIPALFIEEVKF